MDKNQFIEELLSNFVTQFSEKLGNVRCEKRANSGTWFNLDDICGMVGCRSKKSRIVANEPRSEVDLARNMVSGRIAYKIITSSSDRGVMAAVRNAAVDTITALTQPDSALQKELAVEKCKRKDAERRLTNVCYKLRCILDEASEENAIDGSFTL